MTAHRSIKDVRVETVSMPTRYYDVAEAIGYVRGLVDAARLINPETPFAEIAQRAFALMLDEERCSATPELRNLIRHACEGGGFDWAVEEGIEFLKVILEEQCPNIGPEWVGEPKNGRHGASMFRSRDWGLK